MPFGLMVFGLMVFGLMVFGRLPVARLRSVEGILAILAVTFTALLLFGVGATHPLVAGQYLVLIPMC